MLAQFAAEEMVARLWRRDPSLWPAEEREVATTQANLNWLSLPEELDGHIQRILRNAAAAREAGLDHVVFVGMGGSNLACAAILDLAGGLATSSLHLLDTTDPDAILRVREKLPLERTLFVFASKSGKRIETHALLLHFLGALRVAGVPSPGDRCVALTEQGSYLAMLAREYKFRDILFDPPGIFSRFCGLLHFGLLLVAVGIAEETALLKAIGEMKEACGPHVELSQNPAAQLGAFLAAGAQLGYQRLILLSNDELNYFGYRLSQLVGLSLNDDGWGVNPFFAQGELSVEVLEGQCLAVILRRSSGDEAWLGHAEALRNAQIPLVEVELGSARDLVTEIFKWEIATALASAAVGVNCFRAENEQGNLAPLAEELQKITSKERARSTEERLREEGVALYAKGATRRTISNLSLRAALQTLLEERAADGYVAICPFFQLDTANLRLMRKLRQRMSETLGVPVQISTGPRYLYALGKIYKQGPAEGVFIILTDQPDEDLAVPGAPYTFGDLQQAFAVAEWDALENAGKRVVRVHLLEGRDKGLQRFADIATQALARIREFPGERGRVANER